MKFENSFEFKSYLENSNEFIKCSHILKISWIIKCSQMFQNFSNYEKVHKIFNIFFIFEN